MIRPAFYLFACLAFTCVSVSADVAAQTAEDIVFTEIETRIIKEYFDAKAARQAEEEGRTSGKAHKSNEGKTHKANKGKSKGLPPGLAKKESLPPGLAKQLSERGTLPPGLAKRDLPADLQSRLPRPAKGTERVIVDNDVVLIQAATRKVLDVLFDAAKAQE